LLLNIKKQVADIKVVREKSRSLLRNGARKIGALEKNTKNERKLSLPLKNIKILNKLYLLRM